MKNEIITLKLESKEITLTTHDVEGSQLYKAQDLLKGYGLSSDEANDKVRNWKVSQESKAVGFTVLTFKGKYGGTYLTKRQILKLAGYVSYEFEDAVYEAFEMLMDGNTKEAENISKRVAKVRKAQLQDRPRGTIQELYEDSDERSIAEWVHGLLFEDCSNNTAAEIEHRMRFAKSTRDFILSDKCVSRLKVKNGHSSDKDSALLVVAEYMFARKTQYLSLQNTLKDKKLSDIRERSLKIGNIAKRLREEKNMIQAERDIAYIQIDNLNNEIEMIQIETEFLSREIKRVKEEIPF